MLTQFVCALLIFISRIAFLSINLIKKCKQKHALYKGLKFAEERSERPVVCDLVTKVNPHTETANQNVGYCQIHDQNVRRSTHALVGINDENYDRISNDVE